MLTQRAHELKWLVKLHSLPLEDAEALAAAEARASASRQPITSASSKSIQLRGSSGSASGSAIGGASHASPPEWNGDGAGSALLRLGSTLLGTLETLRFGAEELVGCDLVLPAAATGTTSNLGGVGALGGGSALIDSFCVVSSQTEPPVVASGGATAYAAFASDPAEADSAQMASLLAATRHKMAQVSSEADRLRRENASLRQRNTEVGTTLVRAQRRAQEQLRLVRRAILALREISQVPR